MKNINKETLFYFIPGLLAFIYVAFRAIHLDITYDEAWTLNDIAHFTYKDIYLYTYVGTNNHFLNGLLIKFLFSISHETVLIARLPNVLAFLFYLIYARKISTYLPFFPGIALFLLLLLNPFLLDFFSLARGYGLSLSFQIISVYRLLAFIKNKQLRNSNYALLFASLAVFSNFSLLMFWLAVFGTLCYVAFFVNAKSNRKKFSVASFLIALLFAAILFPPIHTLIKRNEFHYGGEVGFYSDTLVSLTKHSQYSPEILPTTYLALNVFLIIFLLGLIGLLGKNLKERENKLASENSVFILLVLAVSASVVQHYVLGTKYMIDRTALFYFPLFIIQMCFALSIANNRLQKVLLSFLLVFFGFNFSINANTYKTVIWYFNSHTEAILNAINEKGKQQHKNVTLDFAWPFELPIYYYTQKNLYPFVTILQEQEDKDKVHPNADYYIYLNKSLEKVGYDFDKQKILEFKKDTLMSFEKEEVYVFENIKQN